MCLYMYEVCIYLYLCLYVFRTATLAVPAGGVRIIMYTDFIIFPSLTTLALVDAPPAGPVQVLPQRTHPTMMTDAAGGYVFW